MIFQEERRLFEKISDLHDRVCNIEKVIVEFTNGQEILDDNIKEEFIYPVDSLATQEEKCTVCGIKKVLHEKMSHDFQENVVSIGDSK